MHALELRITAWVQQWPGLGKPMEWISHLGPGKPMLGLAAVLLCLVGPGFARRFAVLLVLCLWGRELLAMVLQSPRPYWFGEGVRTFRDPPLSVATFGLPSGHATTAAAVWFFLAAEVRRRWAWGLAVAIVGSVAVSRVYLGVHFTSDVVLGVVLGSAGAVAFRRLEGPVSARWSALGGSGRSMAAVAVASGTLLVSAAVQAWVTRAVPEGAWPPYGATARVSTGCAWAAGAIFGAALAAVDPVRWSAESDRWRWRWQRLALTVAPAAFYFV
ncbi:MAG: phosphatase PAP2 family protein, partial [Verrucomicrobiales bacterium]|nr:phosphatase PAP2 family protein [Verrucomicrobiales bacterium]